MSNSVFITIFHPSAFNNRLTIAKNLINEKFNVCLLILETCVNNTQISYLKKNKIKFHLIENSDRFLNFYLKKLKKEHGVLNYLLIFIFKIYSLINKNILYLPVRFCEIFLSYKKLYGLLDKGDQIITSNLFWRVENILLIKISKIKKINLICVPHDLFTKDEEHHHLNLNKNFLSFFYKYLFKKKWLYKALIPSSLVDVISLSMIRGKIKYPWFPNNDAKVILTDSKGHSNYLISQGGNKNLIKEIGSFDVIKKKKKDDKYILIFLPPNQNPESTKNFEFENYEDMINFIIREVKKYKIRSKFLLHPRSLYLRDIIKNKFRNIELHCSKYMNYLPNAKICISWHSSTITKMLWLNKPVLYYDPWFYKLKFPKDNICFKTYKKEEFSKKLNLLLKKQFIIKKKDRNKREKLWRPFSFFPKKLLKKQLINNL